MFQTHILLFYACCHILFSVMLLAFLDDYYQIDLFGSYILSSDVSICSLVQKHSCFSLLIPTKGLRSKVETSNSVLLPRPGIVSRTYDTFAVCYVQ